MDYKEHALGVKPGETIHPLLDYEDQLVCWSAGTELTGGDGSYNHVPL